MEKTIELGYVLSVLLSVLGGVLGFCAVLAVNSLISIAKSVGEIKTQIREVVVRYEALEKRVEDLEDEN